MARSEDQLHERFSPRRQMAGSSNYAFGMIFAGFFVLLTALSLWRHGDLWPWFLSIAAAFAATAFFAPKILAPLNRLWMAFGLLLHKIVNPVVMAIVFFGVVCPLGLLMRLLNTRPIDLEFRTAAPTYWKKRPAVEDKTESMTRQF